MHWILPGGKINACVRQLLFALTFDQLLNTYCFAYWLLLRGNINDTVRQLLFARVQQISIYLRNSYTFPTHARLATQYTLDWSGWLLFALTWAVAKVIILTTAPCIWSHGMVWTLPWKDIDILGVCSKLQLPMEVVAWLPSVERYLLGSCSKLWRPTEVVAALASAERRLHYVWRRWIFCDCVLWKHIRFVWAGVLLLRITWLPACTFAAAPGKLGKGLHKAGNSQKEGQEDQWGAGKKIKAWTIMELRKEPERRSEGPRS